MQRFELTQINTATGNAERAAECCKFSDGTCVVNFEPYVGKVGFAIFLRIEDIDKMHPGLTTVMVDAA